MKTVIKFGAPFILLLVAAGFWFTKSLKEKQAPAEIQVLGEFQNPPDNTTYAWFLVSQALSITYYPNYQEKLTSDEVKTKYGCVSLVSGGFYDSDRKPLGLVITQRIKISGYRQSELFNGVYSINDFETPRITKEVPKDGLRVALQSGPMLIENSFVQKLSLKRDEEARRIVIATTGDNQTIFIVFYNPNSVFMGPLLTDLPQLLTDFQKDTGVILADALNLDGGTASVFNHAGTNLPEAVLSGGFFCIK